MAKYRLTKTGEAGLGYLSTPEPPPPQPPIQTDKPLSDDEILRALPNSEKLTPNERRLLSFLPRVNEAMEWLDGRLDVNWAGRTAKFVGSWAGKALSVLDVGAEGVERFAGLAAQFVQAVDTGTFDDFKNHLADAWYAGSLTADTNSYGLPIFKRDENGKIIGFEVPDDLPGIAGVVRARKRIEELVAQGYDRSEALTIAREEYYDDLGALAIRAQLYDAYVHTLGDPLNLIGTWIKPVERLHAARSAIMTGKLLPGSIEGLQAVADELRLAGKVEEAAAVAARIEDLQKSGKYITAFDKAVIAITGGDPLNPNILTKIPIVKQFTLTPESRALEMLAVVSDHIDSHILNAIDDPAEIVQAFARARAGALGPEFGAAFLTHEGRVAQGVLGVVEAEAQKLYRDWEAIADERRILEDLVRYTEKNYAEVLDGLAKGKLDEFVQLAIAKYGDEAAGALGNIGQASRDILANMYKMPYTASVFKHMLRNSILDATARIGIAKFGLKAKGLFQKFTAAMKAGETLAFLRLNPTFAARNFINNEFTMIARGVWDYPLKNLDNFVAEVFGDIAPYRMSQAFTMSGEFGKASDAGSRLIDEVLRGDRNILDAIRDGFQKQRLPFDFGEISSRIEANASKRAFYQGYMQGWRNHFWKPGKGFDPVPATIRNVIGNRAARGLEDTIRGAMHEKDLIEAVTTKDWSKAASSVLDAVERDLGTPLGDVFGDAYLANLQRGLQKAIEGGPEDVRRFMDTARDTLAKSLEEKTLRNLEAYTEYFANIAQGEGPLGILTGYGDIADMMSYAHAEHALRMQKLAPPAAASEAAELFWKQVREDTSAYWERMYTRVDSALTGMVEGARRAGWEIPDDIVANFQGIKMGWQKFHEDKWARYEEYFALDRSLRTPEEWARINQEIAADYTNMVESEIAAYREMDDLVIAAFREQHPELADAFAAWRKTSRELLEADRKATAQFMEEVRLMDPLSAREAYQRFWSERANRWIEMWANDKTGRAALWGDKAAQEALVSARPSEAKLAYFRNLANAYRVPTISESGAIMEDRLRLIVNKYLREGYAGGEELAADAVTQYERLEDIPEELMAAALEARRIAKGEPAPKELPRFAKPGTEIPANPDTRKLLENSMYPYNFDLAADQVATATGFEALTEIERKAMEAIKRPPLRFGDLPEDVQSEMWRYIDRVQGQMKDARNAAIRFGEYRRDSALLNYNRRYNYNTLLDALMPFHFWTVQSIFKWALHTLDRPQMAAAYLRMRKLLETAGLPDNGFPTRLQGKFRIKAPFIAAILPEWAGDSIYIDPLNVAFPFDQMAAPWEQFVKNQHTMNGYAERVVQRMAENGEITAAQAEEALATHKGDVWELAMATAVNERGSERDDGFDFINLFSSVHAPYVWGYKALTGQAEDIGPLMPLGRMIRQAQGALGIGAADPKKGVIGNIRQKLGLPAFDKWDDYRIERMIANMVADGDITAQEGIRAMIEHDGVIWQTAAERAAKEYGRGGLPILLQFAGIPTLLYPEGEQKQRALQDEFSAAAEAYQNGNPDALAKFFDEHPEYEARLALWKDPPERMQSFLVDQLWERWNNLSGSVDKRIAVDTLGPDFERYFLNKDTRNYDAIPVDTLQIWLKMLGGDPPGTLSKPAAPIEFAPPEVAYVAQQFYDIRKQAFPDYREQQKIYFSLAEGKPRREYLQQHPELKRYWDWRNDFFHRNPSILPYVDDDYELKYKSPQAAEQAFAQPYQFTFTEWQYILSPSTARVLRTGEVPESARAYLEDIAAQLGVTLDDLVTSVQNAP